MSLKKAYLYLVSIISLVIMVVGLIILIDMGLKTWVFTKADQEYYYQTCYPKRVEPNATNVQCTAQEEAEYQVMLRNNRAAQKQRNASQAVAMLLVASPVWYFHWRLARKEA